MRGSANNIKTRRMIASSSTRSQYLGAELSDGKMKAFSTFLRRLCTKPVPGVIANKLLLLSPSCIRTNNTV